MSMSLLTADVVADYRAQVDGIMSRRCGETYSVLRQISPRLDAEERLLTRAWGRGMTPEQFTSVFMDANKLWMRSALYDAPIANRFTAAVSAFASEADGWELGTDGNAYCIEDGQVIRLNLNLNLDRSTSNFNVEGFRVSIGDDTCDALSPANDPFGRVEPPQTTFTDLVTGPDIGDALAMAQDLRLQRGRQALPR